MDILVIVGKEAVWYFGIRCTQYSPAITIAILLYKDRVPIEINLISEKLRVDVILLTLKSNLLKTDIFISKLSNKTNSNIHSCRQRCIELMYGPVPHHIRKIAIEILE